jgi:UDP-N-acetylglucosamine 2-epimerase
MCVVGTRPEAIKMAPVVTELRRYDAVTTLLVSTGQHREILHAALGSFGLAPDVDLAIMQHGASLAQVTCRALEGIDAQIEAHRPAAIVAQGDTTTTFVSSLAAFYRQIPFAHVEAGLRTDRIDNPFPEEYNRRAAGLVAAMHFAPTEWAAENLRNEGKSSQDVYVCGNTGIDAVMDTARQQDHAWFPEHFGRVILMTTHRRENWGEPQRQIALAARDTLEATPDALLVVAMHPNPRVREVIEPILGGHPRVRLIEPPDYAPFVKLIQRAHLILTDSGGVQEEAPSFGVPVLVLRTTTERPEGVHAGTARLVGTDYGAIVRAARELLEDPEAYAKMAKAVSPYGDGRAAARIRAILLRRLGVDSPDERMWRHE